MTDLNPTPSWDNVPAWNKNTVANGETMNAPAQALLNRTEYLKSGLDKIKDEAVTKLQSVADLANKQGKEGQTVRVLNMPNNVGVSNLYTYTESNLEADNGVTVVQSGSGKWVMEVPEAYYASWFAMPTVKNDQSVKLQTGYDHATSKRRAFIIDKDFYVDPAITSGKKVGLYIRSNSVLMFKKGLGSITQLPTSSDAYDIIRIDGISNYLILDAVLNGDKLEHIGNAGEWGYGLTIYQCSGGYIRNPIVNNTWGDGIYIGRSWGTVTDVMPTNVFIDYPVVDGAGRNGISLCAGNNVHINTPLVKNTKGKAPEAGIDIEPEESGSSLSKLINCTIHNATLIDNVSPINVFASKEGRHIDVSFTGVTKFVNSNPQSADTFYFYKRAIGLGVKQSGLVYFEKIIWDSQRTNLILSLENPVSGLKVEIDSLAVIGNVSSITFNYLGTALSGQPYGDFSINKLENSGLRTAMSKYFMTDSANLEIISPILAAKNIYQIYEDPAHYVTYHADSSSDIQHTWLGWSQNTRIMPNKIWVDPSIDTGGSEFITMYTGNDYRELTIGLHHDPATIGNGAGLNGLNLFIDGAVKTTARTKTLGGWIKFQNIQGGRTRVIDSYGSWTFS